LSKLKKISLIVWFTGLALVLGSLLFAASFNFRIGIPMQDITCLPYKAMLLHQVKPSSIARGEFITFQPQQDRMTARFNGQFITKMVGAVAGDTISVSHGALYINNKEFSKLDIAEKAAVALHTEVDKFDRTEVVPPGYLFMVGTMPRSFDSRYWGFLPISEVVGTAYPII
jgi:conjugal transfer pilin signal peptidase TrbI